MPEGSPGPAPRRWASDTEAGRALRLSSICVSLVVLYFVVPISTSHPPHVLVVRILVGLVCLAALAAGLVRQLQLQLDQSTGRRVDGLVISIVVVVIVFAAAFYLLQRRDPTQLVDVHTRLDALYFTMTTLTTVGYGDAHPAGQSARALVLCQMVFDLVFVAAAAALVSSRLRAAAAARAAAHTGPRPEPASRSPEPLSTRPEPVEGQGSAADDAAETEV